MSAARHSSRTRFDRIARGPVSALVALALAVGGVSAAGLSAANAANEGLTITKAVATANTTDIGISNVAGINGEAFSYSLNYSCVTFEPAGCTSVVIHDALPAGLVVGDGVPASWTVVGNDISIPLGTIAAGNGSIAVPVRFATNPALAANATLTVDNTASIAGVIRAENFGSASNTVSVTGRVKPVGGLAATKTATPSTVDEYSGAPVAFSLSATNQGTIPAANVLVSDLDPTFFDAFDITSIPTPALPGGASSVTVETTTDGTVWTAIATPNTPAGHLTGIRATFVGQNPATTAALNFTATLRNQLVSGADVATTGSTAYSNDATNSISYPDSALDRTAPSSAVVTVNAEIVNAPTGVKSFSPSTVTQGSTAAITTTISANGTGQGGAKTVTVSDPAVIGGVTPFGAALNLTGAFSVVWPSGAEEATIVLYNGAAASAPATITNPTASFQSVYNLPAATAIGEVTGFSVTFTSTTGTPIVSAFAATVTAVSIPAAGLTNGNYPNNATVHVQSPSGNSSGDTTIPTVNFTVATPAAAIVTTKNFTRPVVVLGSPTQANVIQLRTTYGPAGSGTNVSASSVVIQDPVNLGTAGVNDFFDEYNAEGVRAVDCQTGDALKIEYYDGSAWQVLTSDACLVSPFVPLAIPGADAQGIRLTYSNAAGIAPGRQFQPEVLIRARLTNRETNATVLDMPTPTIDDPIETHESPANCSEASAYIAGSATPAATDILGSDFRVCPTAKTDDLFKSGSVGITKLLDTPDGTKSGREGSGATMTATFSVTSKPSEDAGSLEIQDPAIGDVYARTFAAVTDLVSFGPYTVPKYEQAHVDFLDAAGTVIASSPTVLGGAVLNVAGDPSYAGFRFVLEQNPADPGIDPGIESESYGSLTGLVATYKLRDTFRDAVAGTAHAAGDLVRNNICYTVDSTTLHEDANSGTPDVPSDCVLPVDPFTSNNGIGNVNDAGWLLNEATVNANLLVANEDGHLTEGTMSDVNSQQVFRIINGVANAQLAKTVSPDSTADTDPTTGVVLLPDAQGIGSAQQRTITLTAKNTSDRALTEATISDSTSTFWDTFQLLSVVEPVSPAVPAGSAVTFDLTFSDGTPAATGLAAAAANALPNLAAVTGVTAHIVGAIPVNGTAAVGYAVQLRSGIGATVVTNTATVAGKTLFANSKPSDSSATITVREPGTRVSTSKTLALAAGSTSVVDSRPVLTTTLVTTNSGELGLSRIVTEDDDYLGDHTYPTTPVNVDRDFWNLSDFVGVTSIAAPTGAESTIVEYYNGTAWVSTGAFTTIAALNAILTTVTVEGLRVTYTSDSGSLIDAGQSGTLVFTVRLEDTVIAGTAITNCAEQAYSASVSGALNYLDPACASFTPTAGVAQVAVSKVFAATNQPTSVDTAGSTQRYKVTVTNTGTQRIGSHGFPFQIIDKYPAELAYNLATANPVATLPGASSTLGALPAATVDANSVTWTWPAGQYLAPGDSVVLEVSFDVAAALPTGTTVVNIASVDGNDSVGCASGTVQADGSCEAPATLTVNSAGAIRATKSIDGSSSTGASTADPACAAMTGFVSNPCVAVTPSGSDYTWKLDLQNSGNSDMNNLVLIDLLPKAGDTGAYLNVNRGSEWRGTPKTAPVVTSPVPAGVTIGFEYLPAGADLAACIAETQALAGTTCAAWVALPAGTVIPADAQALRIAADYGTNGNPVFAAGNRLTVTWVETAPETLAGTVDTSNAAGAAVADNRLTQWNSFGFRVAEAGSGYTYLNESNKAGAVFDSAAFSVTKNVSNGTIAPTALFGSFAVDYSCIAPGEAAPHTGTVVLADGETRTVSGFATGSVCTLSEQDAPAGYSWTPLDSDPATPGYQLALTQAFGVVSTTLTNPYVGQALTINKTVLGEADSDAEFDFSVVCTFNGSELVLPDGADYTLGSTGGQILINGLPVGTTCVVSETNSGGAQTVTISGGTVTGDATTVVIPEGGAQVAITNNFGVNGVVIAKDVVGTLNSDIDLGDFTIVLTCTDPVNGPRTETVNLADGESTSFTDFANGTSCVVSEPAPGNKFAVSTKVLVGGVESSDGSFIFAGTGLGETVQITVENHYDTGSLAITKAVEGATTATDYTFAVSCAWNGYSISENVTVAAGATRSVSGIPVDAICGIVETDSGQSRVTYDSVGPYVITAAGQSVAVLATNYFETGITVTKRVTNNTALTAAQIAAQVFAFTAVCTYNDATTLDEAFSLKNGESKHFDSILVGSDCVVTETDASGATSTSSTFTTAAGDTTTEGTTSTVALTAGDNLVTVNNVYAATALAITKTVSGPAPIGAKYDFALTCTWNGLPVDLTGVAGLTTATPGSESTFTLAAAETLSVGTLPIGALCDVVETNSHGAASVGYTVEGSATASTATGVVLTASSAGDDNVRTVTVLNRFSLPSLAYTGANIVFSIIAALLLGGGGIVLLAISLYRRRSQRA